jgi:hypothetical protein
MAINYAPLQAQLDLSPLREGIAQQQAFKAQSEARALQQKQFDYAVAQDTAATQRRDGFNAAYQDAILDPSQAKFDNLRATYPEFHAPIDAGWQSYSAGQQRDMLGTSASLVSALTNNRPDLALHALQQRRTALAKTNTDTTETDALIGMVQSGDPVQLKAARGIAGMVLAQQAGDKFDTVWARLNKVDNDEEVQDDRVRAAAADADYKESRARFAPRVAAAQIGRAEATAADARSRQSRRDSMPSPRATAGTHREPPSPTTRAAGAKSAGRTPTATGPDGKKYVVRGGKWVPAS